MPTDTTDVTKMPLPGGNVNSPASGTYGEKAALERLKSQLPGVDAGAGPTASNPAAPMPTPPAGAGISNSPPPGVPSGIMAPTSRPDVPVSTPLQQGPVSPLAGAQTGNQQRLAILDSLANSPNVSDSTREWAQSLVQSLIKRSSR